MAVTLSHLAGDQEGAARELCVEVVASVNKGAASPALQQVGKLFLLIDSLKPRLMESTLAAT